jgi:hypothetical protein
LDRKGRILAYETWWAPAEFDQENSLEAQGVEPGDRLGSPRIRVRSLAEGRERFFERGSRSPSFRSDGAIAYTVGDDPFARSQRPFLTHVRVRRTFRQAPRTWSRSPGRYTVLGWAGRRLLVERSIPAGFPELLVFDGPRRERSLGSGVNLVAVRPDGQALLVRRPREVQVRVLSTNDGSLLAAGDLAEPVFGIGHWLGEFVAVATQGGMAILRVQTDRVESVQSFAIPSGRSLQQPRFVGEDAFSAWTSGGGDDSRPNSATLYRCTLATPSCVAREFPLRSLPRPVFDVSRP